MTPDERGPTASWTTAAVERIVVQTPRVKSFFIRAPLPVHVAGQHVDVRLTAEDGYQAQRSYSIASAPGNEIELAIEELREGEVSSYFHEVAQPGDTFEMRGPIGGHFIWRPRDGGPLLLIGGGSGVAPLMAMVRERMRGAPDVPTMLVYSARAWEEIIFRDELLQAHDRRAGFDLALVTTRGPAHRKGDLGQRLDAQQVSGILRRWGHVPRHAYVCGADGFVETVADALVGAGLAPSSVRAERYGGPSK